jgi:hypothetical protein
MTIFHVPKHFKLGNLSTLVYTCHILTKNQPYTLTLKFLIFKKINCDSENFPKVFQKIKNINQIYTRKKKFPNFPKFFV